VKSLSMAMGIQQPGFQLLSLAPHQYWQATKSPTTYTDVPCFLPGQLGIYLSVYAPCFVISLLAVVISNIPRVASRSGLRHHTKRHYSPHKLASRPRSGTHDDNEMTSDEDSSSPFHLPPPVSASSQISRANRNMPFSWLPRDRLRRSTTRTKGDSDSIFSISFLYRLWGTRGLRKRKHNSFVGKCICDVRDIAVFPLFLFMLISLWITFS
jgi:ethanolamine phosphate phosphodiesterase